MLSAAGRRLGPFTRWSGWLIALVLALALVADWWFASWPAGTGGWLALLGLSAFQWYGRSMLRPYGSSAAAVPLALAATLTPAAAPALPLAVLAVWRQDGPRRAVAVGLAGTAALAASLLVGSRAGWIGSMPWEPTRAGLTAGAHDLWWLLLEHLALEISPAHGLLGLPLWAWALVVWLPCYALSGLTLWRRRADLPLAAGYAGFGFTLLTTGRTPADGLPAALIALPVAGRGKWWALLTAVAVGTSIVNLVLAPASVPPPAPRAAIDARTLNALARLVLLVAWSIALGRSLWPELPERWRRVLVLEPPPAPGS